MARHARRGLYLPFDRSGGFVGPSWLLGKGLVASVVGVVVWVIAGAGFIGAAWGFWQSAPWWTTAAWIGSIGTIAAIALWAGAIQPGMYAGGLLAVGTIVYLLLNR